MGPISCEGRRRLRRSFCFCFGRVGFSRHLQTCLEDADDEYSAERRSLSMVLHLAVLSPFRLRASFREASCLPAESTSSHWKRGPIVLAWLRGSVALRRRGTSRFERVSQH